MESTKPKAVLEVNPNLSEKALIDFKLVKSATETGDQKAYALALGTHTVAPMSVTFPGEFPSLVRAHQSRASLRLHVPAIFALSSI